jgi:hypothetical protein
MSFKRNKFGGHDLQLVTFGSAFVVLNASLWSRHDITDAELFYISVPLAVVAFAAMFWHVMR